MHQLVSYGFLALPNVLILFSLAGALLLPIWRRTGMALVLCSSLSLFVAATPAFSSFLTRYLESQVPRNLDLKGAQAIVVLAGDVRAGDDNLPDALGPLSVDRLLLAVDAYHQLHLPIAVSGGPMSDSPNSAEHPPVGQLMAIMLSRFFSIQVTWVETRSRSTYENALYTAQLLRSGNIDDVVVTTQPRDAPRVIWSFEQFGIHAVPWPARRTPLMINQLADFLPNASALEKSFYAIHELIGGVYYRVRYRSTAVDARAGEAPFSSFS